MDEAMTYTRFDISSWTRKRSFEFYKKFDDPYFNVTFRVDVTALAEYTRNEGLSFFANCMYECLVAANAIDLFRMRRDGEGIRLYKIIHAGSTVFYDGQSFGFAYYNNKESLREFSMEVKNVQEKCNREKSFEPSASRDDLIYFSSLPWIHFTGLKHAQDRNINSSIPRISFGKYISESARILMPVNIEINHAFMDGFHVGLFAEALQKNLMRYES